VDLAAPGCGDGVAFRLQTARSVDRNAPAECGDATLGELAAVAEFAQAYHFDLLQFSEGAGVVGLVMATGFGQTEGGLNSTFFSQQELASALATGNEARLQGRGRVTPFVSVEIMDEEGRLLPLGERGELVVRGDQIMIGYWNNPEESKRASAFGWHRTGDVGYKDPDGWVFLVDRKRDMIIS